MNKYSSVYVLILLMVIILMFNHTANQQQSKEGQRKKLSSHFVTVRPLNSNYFFSGTIQPLKSVVITSPTDGVVSAMNFHYGDAVSANQLLFTLVSDKFQNDYKTALMGYVKSKNEFSDSQSQLKEAEFLHQHKLISDDEYKSKKTAFYNAQLGFLQTKDTLAILLKQLDVKGVDLYKLAIDDVSKLNQAFQIQNGAHTLRVLSPATGVALLPEKTESNEGGGKKLGTGDSVKQGDVLAMIGDMNGLIIHISVNEFIINQLKMGQKVIVTGAAFPGMQLDGGLTGMDKEGSSTQGNMPTFPVEISVPHVTKEQQAVIHAGMSAKVEIDLAEPDQLIVPIKAVYEKDGETYIKVEDGKTKKLSERLIKTGRTTADGSVIVSNVKPGDRVLVTD